MIRFLPWCSVLCRGRYLQIDPLRLTCRGVNEHTSPGRAPENVCKLAISAITWETNTSVASTTASSTGLTSSHSFAAVRPFFNVPTVSIDCDTDPGINSSEAAHRNAPLILLMREL